MKRARTETAVAVTVFFAIIWVIVTNGIRAVWLTEEVRVFGMVMLPTAIVAGLLVAYLDWRAKLLRRTRDGHNEYRRAA